MRDFPEICPHQPPCPGCPRFGDCTLDPAAWGKLVSFCSEAGAPAPVAVVAATPGYRHRARLAVRGRIASPKVGIFREGTHQVVDVPRCPIHHPLVNRVAAALKRCLVVTRTPTYSDAAHAGLVRYLQVVVERSSQRAQVVVVANTERAAPVQPLLDSLAAELGEDLHSLYFNGNPACTNVILGPHWERVVGAGPVEERVGGARVFFPPGAFGQSHLELADRAVEAIHERVAAGRRVVELYAGVGAISLGLVERSTEVVFNEIGAGSLAGLRHGVAVLPRDQAARVTVVEGAAGAAAEAIRAGDTVIVDPPRKGLDAELLARLCSVRAGRLLYLSCQLSSFLRDARALTQEGGYRVTHCRAYGFLPFTPHIETFACFG